MAARTASQLRTADAVATISAAARLVGVAQDLGWDKPQAQFFVDLLRSAARDAGMAIRIIGSVAAHGISADSLDVQAEPIVGDDAAEGFDSLHNFITRTLGAEYLGEDENRIRFRLLSGRIVDMFISRAVN